MVEKLCENCFLGICYFPGDEIRPRDGGELRVTKEFYERTCVTGVGRFFRRLIGDKFDPIVLVRERCWLCNWQIYGEVRR